MAEYEEGPCFLMPEVPVPISANTVILTQENIRSYHCDFARWLTEEIRYAQPCAAVVEDRRILSL